VYVQPVLAAGAAMGAPVADTTDEIAENLVAQIRHETERVKGIFDIRWEFHTFRGDPYGGLVKAADQLKADAVIVGAGAGGAPDHRVGRGAVGEGGAVAGDGGAVADPACRTPARSSASRVRWIPAAPSSRVWLEAVEQAS
jgi:nucleotide-binding universal stress UspA family protein